MKTVGGADCGSVTIRRHLQEKDSFKELRTANVGHLIVVECSRLVKVLSCDEKKLA